MKHYTGTKTLQAELMTYGEAHKHGFIHEDAFVEELSDHKGYHVIYSDGYESWSPAEVFEASYKVSDTPLDRVNIECAEVRERTNKLGQFIHNQNRGKDYQELPLGTRAMLLAQFHAMCAYSNLLDLRQSCMEGGVDCMPDGLSFEQILPLLREGFVIRRNGWNSKGLVVFKQVPAHITGEIIPKMQSLPDAAKKFVMEHATFVNYTNQCLIYNKDTGEANSWTPTISDVFAEDWVLVTEIE